MGQSRRQGRKEGNKPRAECSGSSVGVGVDDRGWWGVASFCLTDFKIQDYGCLFTKVQNLRKPE